MSCIGISIQDIMECIKKLMVIFLNNFILLTSMVILL